MTCLEKLEEKVGGYFEKLKKERKLSDINYKLVDKLDKLIYVKVIKMKSDYNKYAPIQGNEKII